MDWEVGFSIQFSCMNVTSVEDSPRLGPAFTEDNTAPWRTWYGKTGASQSRRWHRYWTLVFDQPITSFMRSWSSKKFVQDRYPSDCPLKWKRGVSMLTRSFCVGMRLMVKHFCSIFSLEMRAGYTFTSQNESDKAWNGATPRPQNRKSFGCSDLQAMSWWLSSGITRGRF